MAGEEEGEAGWWLSKVLNLELKLGWEGRQFSVTQTTPCLPAIPPPDSDALQFGGA